MPKAELEYINEEDRVMTIETKFSIGDAVKYWDSSSGWLYGNIQKIAISVFCSVPYIQYVVDFSDEFNLKNTRVMEEYQLLGIEEDVKTKYNIGD